MVQEHRSESERMQRRGRLRLLSIVVPLAGVVLLYVVRLALLHLWPAGAVDVTVGVLATAGILIFSWTIFRVIEGQDRRLARQHVEIAEQYETERRLRAQLEALHQASLSIASARTPEQILQRLVDLARELIGARYSALGVLGPQGAIDGFYTSGISQEQRARIGPIPQGHGLLGVILTEGMTLRISDIAADPRSVGFPPGHPPMRTLLGVPVAHGDQVVGNLYLADKREGAEFSAEDERLLRLLAAHAAVVIENARLAEQVQTLAVAAERDRISRDLHDSVIQAIYAVNLELEDAAEDIEADPDGVRARLDGAIDRLGEVMKDLRRYILGLQPPDAGERPLRDALSALLAEARAHTLIEPHVRIEGDVGAVPPALAREVLQITREAVANVVRHARASRLWLTLEVTANEIHLRVADNGVGFDGRAPVPSGHYGLRNLHERARSLGGMLTITSSPGRGTAVDLRAPLVVAEQERVHV